MSSGAGYDNTVTTFSPDGRVFQVEYAEKAYEKASSVIGVKCTDGVIIAAEKPITSKLLKPKANKRILPLDLYSSMAVSGIQPDGRAIANSARKEATEYLEFYGFHIPGNELARRIAGRIHKTTIYWQERPFGCACVISTFDDFDSYGLYSVGPTGVLTKQKATCVGRLQQSAKTELEKIDFDTITVKDAVKVIAMIFYKLHDDVKEKEFEIEMIWQSTETKNVVKPVPDSLIDDAVKEALEAKQRSLMEDSEDDD